MLSYKYLYHITILLLIIFSYSGHTEDDTPQKVNILIFEGQPLQGFDKEGHAIGFNVEILREIAKIENWELSFTSTSISNGFSKMQTDKRVSEALIFISAKNPTTKDFLDYTKTPITHFFTVIISNKANKINNYEDLNHKKFAITGDSAAYKTFQSFAEKLGIEYTPVEFPNLAGIVKYVNDHEDAFGVIADKPFKAENINYPDTEITFFIADEFPLHYSVRKGKDKHILQTIDKYLSSWKKSKTSPFYIHYNQYLQKLKNSFEAPQNSYLKPIHLIIASIILFFLLLWIFFLRNKIKQNNLKILAKEEDIKLTLMNIDDGVIITDNKGKIELINSVAEQLIGYTQSQSQGRHITNILKIEEAETFEELISPIEKILSHNTNIKNSGTSTLISRNGNKSIINYSTSPIIIDNHLKGIILVLQDITLETTQRMRIAQSEKELQQILQSINEGILYLDTNLRIIRYNDKITEILNKDKRHNIIGQKCPKICFTGKYNRNCCPAQSVLQEHKTITNIFEKDENTIILVTASPVTNHDNTIVGIIESFMDITALRKKEAALQASEEKYRLLIENQTDVVLKLTPDGIILFASPSFCRLFDKTEEELINQSYLIINTKNRLKIEQTLEELKSPPHKTYLEIEHNTVKGKRWIAWNNAGILDTKNELDHILAVGRDITDSRLADDKLKQVQKMEAIGQLAGGIAHDFNNMLGGVVGFAELIFMQKESSEITKNFCNQIIKTSERAADLTQQLLSFARKGKAVSTKIDAHTAIKNAVAILRRSVNKNIDIQVKLNAKNSMIVGDPAQIQSAILNLGINARDAMHDMDGCFTVETSTSRLSISYCKASNFNITPGDYLLIKATDTGEGMTKETMEHIFEPFFTTKEVGKGTGLGLASIFGTVTLHHGAITAYSEPDSGTEFHIFLPLAAAEHPENEEENFSVEEMKIRNRSQKSSILVIDDEEIIRVLAKSLLEDMGYSVLLAQNGFEGLEIYKANRHEIQIVLLDVIMPKMSGKEALRKLIEINPEVNVIISSGFAQSDKIEDFLELGAKTFIKKPYRQKDLFKVINQLTTP